jgi:hypothetical protein
MASSRKRDRQGKEQTGNSVASVNLRRRRLVKGAAAAAPGIFTLYSGSAIANASSRQCVAQSEATFTGEEEYASEQPPMDGFARLGQGPGIYVEWTDPSDSSITEDQWLIAVEDETGNPHYVASGYVAGNSGNVKPGVSWDEVAGGLEWLPVEDSGSGIVGSPLKLRDPVSGNVFTQNFEEPEKTMQVLACVDDSGNIVSAYPAECEALGLQPPSGSCWASIGAEAMNNWWG